MMSHYRRKLIEAASALVTEGDLNMRLTHVAGYLLQIDDNDVPPSALQGFHRLRNPLIAKPLIAHGEMIPRDLANQDARAAALDMLDLLVTEMGGA
ncbi:MAG: hypothetical protein ACRYGP_02010 [Janthinobacterium lividum]